MNRYELLKKLLAERKFFKLVCGAGNEDPEEVRRLALIFTLAGSHMLDLSANIDIVEAAKNGIDEAKKIAPSLGKNITIKPYLNVSIGLKSDPHARKAKIYLEKCVKCGACIPACKQEAINNKFVVMEYRCIGCGHCESACEVKAIGYIHKNADFKNILPECAKRGVETMELHAVTFDDSAVFDDWNLLNDIIKDNYLSMCLDRSLLSNRDLVERVRKAHKITGDRLIIQADGVPMSGEEDNFNTTLQAVACADIMQKSNIPFMVLLSGGTNSRTGLLAKQCGVKANGVAVGSFARKIVREFTKRDGLEKDLPLLGKAVEIAAALIKSNIEAISG